MVRSAARAAESRCVITKYYMVKQVGQVGICSIEAAGHNAKGDGLLGGPAAESICVITKYNMVKQVGQYQGGRTRCNGKWSGGAVRAAESRCVLTKYNMVKQVGQVGTCSIEAAGHDAIGDGPGGGGPGRRIKMCSH
ncbi:hypothetical protein J6590_001801 [Homalodisca vitripennis]|nr:hypothetical protein J6590_001801 [Homalodisca vitripennis]